MQKHYRTLTLQPPPLGTDMLLLLAGAWQRRPWWCMLAAGGPMRWCVSSANSTKAFCVQSSVFSRCHIPTSMSQPATLMRAGALVHHVLPGVRRQGLPAHTAVLPDEAPGSVRCELEVLEARSVKLGPAARALGWPETAWEGLLVLRTGRTHQVIRPVDCMLCHAVWLSAQACIASIGLSLFMRMLRAAAARRDGARARGQPMDLFCAVQIRAQFAAVGAPLLGDSLYGPLAAEGAPEAATANADATAADRERLLRDLAAGNAAANTEGRERMLREPLSAGIGLQACRLTVVDGEELMGGQTCFKAPAPWWHH